MYSNIDLTKAIKIMSNQAYYSTYPVKILNGTVYSVSPLKIYIDQKLIIEESQLLLCREVTEYDVDMTVDHLTENRGGGSGDSAYESHNHRYLGRKTFRVHKGLCVGEKVVLIQAQGGQTYYIIDRVGSL
ncbi:MAG: DUF2577 domain-containing protein [Lachnospirales bacterium]